MLASRHVARSSLTNVRAPSTHATPAIGVLASASASTAAARRARTPALGAHHTSTRPASRRRVTARGQGDDAASSPSTTAAAAAAAATAAVEEEEGPLSVEIDTADARRSIRLDVAPMGYGQAIVVVEVAGGSEAEEVGVRPGLRLTAISDPIRRNEVWKLQDRPSLKNIRELLKMRSADTIQLEFEPWDGVMPAPGVERGNRISVTSSSGNSASASTSASVAGSALSSVDGAGGAAAADESIGERLAREYAAASASGRTVTAVQQRQQRRQERMELDAARDDRPFLLGVFALFVLPPLVILLVAWKSGYLDSLYLSTLTRQL